MMKQQNPDTNPSRPLLFVKWKGRWMALLLILLTSCTGCGKATTPDNDTDPCAGRCGTIQGKVCPQCSYGFTCNAEQYCVETGTTEIDPVPDTQVDSKPDTSDNDTVACLDLKVYSNVKKSGFPLKDRNGKITFCRPGCDTPTENDPQCVRNLWEWVNWGRYQEYKSGKADYTECYPWPCEMPEMSANPVPYSPCDRMMTGDAASNYSISSGALFDLKLHQGTAGILMAAQNTADYASNRMIEYNVEKNKYYTAAYAIMGTYHYNRFVFVTGPEHWSKELGQLYIVSTKKVADTYTYEVIYDDEQHKTNFSRPPFIGDKWVVLNLLHTATNIIEVVYAKVDEWQWHSLKPGKVYEGNTVGDKLTFLDSSNNIFVCDLSKLPFDPYKECQKINRTGEAGHDPRLNDENPNELIYHDLNKKKLYLVDLSGEQLVYTELPYTGTEKDFMGAYPDQFSGNMLLYSELYLHEGTGRRDLKACFYRIDQKKQYCPAKPTKEKDQRYDQGFGSFDGSYQLWKTSGGSISRLRDLQCYCEKEGVCPFEE